MSDFEKFSALNQEEITTAIESARSFSALEDVIDEVSPITGSDGYVYSADELVGIIKKVQMGETTPESITRTHGLRAKVVSLLETTSTEETDERDTHNPELVLETAEYKELLDIAWASLNPKSGQINQETLKSFLDSVKTRDVFLEKLMPGVEPALDHKIRGLIHPQDANQRSYGRDTPVVQRLEEQKKRFATLRSQHEVAIADYLYGKY